MGLKSLIRREFAWWTRSLGLWWAVPLCILLIECFPLKIIWLYDIDFRYLEEQWSLLTGFYRDTVSQFSLLAPLMQMGGATRQWDGMLNLDPAEMWKNAVCPTLQMWGMLCLPLIVVPLAIASFNRDRESGLFLLNRVMGGSSLHFLLAKQAAMAVHFLWMHAISYVCILLFFRHATPHPELFRLADPLWLVSWFGSAISVSLLAVSVSWATCFVTRNNQSEIYNAMLVITAFSAGSLAIMARSGWGMGMALTVTVSALFLTVALDALMASWMRKERFVIH